MFRMKNFKFIKINYIYLNVISLAHDSLYAILNNIINSYLYNYIVRYTWYKEMFSHETCTWYHFMFVQGTSSNEKYLKKSNAYCL